jgi:hypothetical protein
MTNYHFRTKEFGISDTGIHFLRSGFNYETILFSEINEVKIERGKELHNWIIILLLGAVLLIFGIYISIPIINMIIHFNFEGPRSAQIILFLTIPFVGAYFVYNSFRTGILLKINYKQNKTHKLPLKEIAKEKKLDEFITMLKKNTIIKVNV